MDKFQMQQMIERNNNRLTALETILPTLATKLDIQRIVDDLKWNRLIIMSAALLIFVDIVMRALGLR